MGGIDIVEIVIDFMKAYPATSHFEAWLMPFDYTIRMLAIAAEMADRRAKSGVPSERPQSTRVHASGPDAFTVLEQACAQLSGKKDV